ncbi:IS5 family transposase [Streptomyces sp. B27]|uniref:IS5 family transposase n=1 Tax=Streptomyces sp. B27 TaxID=2485015 RepID=UPI001F0C06EF|nr:IS5 family transposase [Streptomyces sp. B27]
MGRGDLSDDQWAVLEPLLPVAGVGRPARSRRRLVDGIRWRVRTGAPWRDVPPEYGPWQTIYGLFRHWQRQGVWQQILAGLQARADAAGMIVWEVNVDSTICRAHQHAAGARRDGAVRRSRRAASTTSPRTTGWVGRGAASRLAELTCRSPEACATSSDERSPAIRCCVQAVCGADNSGTDSSLRMRMPELLALRQERSAHAPPPADRTDRGRRSMRSEGERCQLRTPCSRSTGTGRTGT